MMGCIMGWGLTFSSPTNSLMYSVIGSPRVQLWLINQFMVFGKHTLVCSGLILQNRPAMNIAYREEQKLQSTIAKYGSSECVSAWYQALTLKFYYQVPILSFGIVLRQSIAIIIVDSQFWHVNWHRLLLELVQINRYIFLSQPNMA